MFFSLMIIVTVLIYCLNKLVIFMMNGLETQFEYNNQNHYTTVNRQRRLAHVSLVQQPLK